MQNNHKRYVSEEFNIMYCINLGIYAKIAAYSGFLCTVCRKNAYFAEIFAQMRK